MGPSRTLVLNVLLGLIISTGAFAANGCMPWGGSYVEEHKGYQLVIFNKKTNRTTDGSWYKNVESCIVQGNELGNGYSFECEPAVLVEVVPCIG